MESKEGCQCFHRGKQLHWAAEWTELEGKQRGQIHTKTERKKEKNTNMEVSQE